jgi:signal peptidase I
MSFFIAGLGQVYAGRLGRGVLGYILSCFAVLLSIILLVKLSFGLLPLAQMLVINTIIGVLLAIDAYKLAKKAGDFIPKFYNKWYVYLLLVILVGYLSPAFYVAYAVMGAARVPTGAMQNTVLPGDHVVLDKTAYNLRNPLTGAIVTAFRTPQRGDIITFIAPKEPSETYMHRVVGLPGDKVEVKGTQLFINDKVVGESYAHYETADAQFADFGPAVVPESEIFVLGDNRNNSYDSRFWGGVPFANIGGKAKGIYWSLDEPSGQIRWERIGRELR